MCLKLTYFHICSLFSYFFWVFLKSPFSKKCLVILFLTWKNKRSEALLCSLITFTLACRILVLKFVIFTALTVLSGSTASKDKYRVWRHGYEGQLVKTLSLPAPQQHAQPDKRARAYSRTHDGRVCWIACILDPLWGLKLVTVDKFRSFQVCHSRQISYFSNLSQ